MYNHCYSLAAFAIALMFGAASQAATINGKVVAIMDGDTIGLVADKVFYKVRLSGIDAPEKSQAFGTASKKALSRCAYGRSATVKYHKQDKYDRIIGKLLVSGYDCNLSQVQKGFAWHYKRYAHEQSKADQSAYAKAHSDAKSRRLGMWTDRHIIEPEKFRKSH